MTLIAVDWVGLLSAAFVTLIVMIVIIVWAVRSGPSPNRARASRDQRPPQAPRQVVGAGASQNADRDTVVSRGGAMDSARMCLDVSEALWRVHHGREDAPHLIWPATRSDAARVSEQESKILITHWLESAGQYYSIETPTRQMYRQSGNAEMSARLDVTVYGSRDRSRRILNIELKAGTASVEAFRKDFEKLLREGIPGLWFHTLAAASQATWSALEGKMVDALGRVLEHAETAAHPVHFAFCVLDTPLLVQFDIDFAGEWRGVLEDRLRAALAAPDGPAWTAAPKPRPAPSASPARSYDGGTRKSLVYMPSLEPATFVHLSTRGDSYALRTFTEGRTPERWLDPACKTLSELLARHAIAIEVDVQAERKPLDSERDYWTQRIAELNREHGIG
jgi:hypothetical protein